MPHKNPNIQPVTAHSRPILRAEIEEAQRNTKSNMAAARYLNVSYERYRRYAKLYGIFEQHLNPQGNGIDKGFSKRPTSIPLKEIFAGKHPTYSIHKLKNRLLARKLLPNHCNLCNFNEARIHDNKIPLLLSFKDNNPLNKTLENMELLCYNCFFLTAGSPLTTHRHTLLTKLRSRQSVDTISPTIADAYDSQSLEDITLTEDELEELYSS